MGTLVRTLWYLKPIQVVGRIIDRAKRRRDVFLGPPRPPFPADFSPLPPTLDEWDHGPTTDLTTWEFLSDPVTYPNGIDWNDPIRSKLWLYHLHSFDALPVWDVPAGKIAALLTDWIARNPWGRGVGWDPYPISLRAANWIKWLSGPGRGIDAHARAAIGRSLLEQLHYLEKHIEYQVQGNHLLKNAKALVMGGAAFSGPLAQRLWRTGVALWARELPVQVLSDGGHFERAPSYHATVLGDLLDTIAVMRGRPAVPGSERLPAFERAAAAMIRFLRGILHPDGDIPLFGDSTFDMSPSPSRLLAFSQSLGISESDTGADGGFSHSGFWVLKNNTGALIARAGAPGPRYLVAHAHADQLSYELSLHGHRTIVDSGVHAYAAGPDRDLCRGTAAHNTLVVNGEEQAEMWDSFRCGRRGYGQARVTRSGTNTILDASHNGYRHRGWIVNRRIAARPNGWDITDQVTGKKLPAEAVGWIHFHPDITVEPLSDGSFRLRGANRPDYRLDFSSGEKIRIKTTLYSPRFGQRLARPSVSYRLVPAADRSSLTAAYAITPAAGF